MVKDDHTLIVEMHAALCKAPKPSKLQVMAKIVSGLRDKVRKNDLRYD